MTIDITAGSMDAERFLSPKSATVEAERTVPLFRLMQLVRSADPMTLQVSKRTSAAAAKAPDGERSAASCHLVTEPNAGVPAGEEVMREILGDQEAGLAVTTRLEALSDGTFAIIITLLVL